jgi:hypothetical protein
MGGGFNKKPDTGGLVHRSGSAKQLGANAPAPGRRTLTEQLGVGPPVQRSASSELAQANDAAVHARSPVVQRKSPDDAHGAEPAPKPPQVANIARLIQLLAAPPPASGGHDDVYTLLFGLSMPDLLAAMDGAADAGHLPQLHARVTTWTNPFFVAKLLSALYAVELVRVPPSAVLNAQLNAAGMALDLLPQDQQIQILEYVLHHRGAGVSVTEVYEGALAMRESKTAASVPPGHNESAASVGPMAGTMGEPGPVEPGPWTPPGKQPIPLYIGNNAHARIAATYVAAHDGDVVRTNSSPLKSILKILDELLASRGPKVDQSALSDDELGLVPDITNLTRLHLYEIKPLFAQGAGAAKAAAYVGLFAKAGVTVALGPTTEPGTQGGVPAPGGVFMFWSPQPGVIVYQYRKGRLVPVPVPEPEPATERSWKFELQPLTPQQKQMVTTLTVGGILLMIATMILLAPVGA